MDKINNDNTPKKQNDIKEYNFDFFMINKMEKENDIKIILNLILKETETEIKVIEEITGYVYSTIVDQQYHIETIKELINKNILKIMKINNQTVHFIPFNIIKLTKLNIDNNKIIEHRFGYIQRCLKLDNTIIFDFQNFEKDNITITSTIWMSLIEKTFKVNYDSTYILKIIGYGIYCAGNTLSDIEMIINNKKIHSVIGGNSSWGGSIYDEFYIDLESWKEHQFELKLKNRNNHQFQLQKINSSLKVFVVKTHFK